MFRGVRSLQLSNHCINSSILRDTYHWYTYMPPLSASSGCHNMAWCCRSFGQEQEKNILCDQSKVCWGCPKRRQNIPGSVGLATSAQIPALSWRTCRSSSDRSGHSASRWRHCHGNAARTLRRCNIRRRCYLRYQHTTNQLVQAHSTQFDIITLPERHRIL